MTFAPSFTVGYTGHLYEGRGARHILEVAKRLPDVQFLLVGGNPEDVASLQSQIPSPTVPVARIHLTGFVPNSELPRYQAACDILLMPYQQRVAASSGGDISAYLSPMKLFEYLACGRVIISSNLPVLQEVLNEKNAIRLPPDDIDAWVQAIEDVRANPDKYAHLAAQARKDAEKYTWDARAKKIFGNG